MKQFYSLVFALAFSGLWSQSFYNNNASTGDYDQPAVDKDSNIYVYHSNRLEKYDKNLNPLWAKIYSGINFQNLLLSTTGSMYFLKGDSTFGKLNPDGSLAWMKSVKTGTALSAGSTVTVATSGYSPSLFLDRNDNLVFTGLLTVSGYPFSSSVGTAFLKCDTLGNFKKCVYVKTLYSLSGMNLTGLHDSAGYYHFIYDYGDCPMWPNCNFSWGKIIYSEFADSVITRITNGNISVSITSGAFINVMYKSKNKNVHYRRISYFSGPGLQGLYLFKYRNNCAVWRLSATHSSSLIVSNFDGDERGNCFLTFSKGAGADGFMRVDSNGISDGALHQYTYSGPMYALKARVINYNNYFMDGYGLSSNPLLAGRFDTTLNISCTNTMALGSTAPAGSCGATSTVSSTYSLSNVSFNTLTTTVTSVSVAVNKSFCLSLGLPETKHNDHFAIFPNPSSGKFVVEVLQDPGYVNSTLEIYNAVGNKLLSTPVFQNKFEADLSSYGKGFYLIRMNSGGRTSCKRIIIE